MPLVLVSFIAGVLTVIAPCILPILPIIIGGATQDHRRRNPYVITGSLAVAIVVFTLLLKSSTLLIDIPQSVWTTISGAIIITFGLTSLFPSVWTSFSTKIGLQNNADHLLESSAQKSGLWGDVLLGLALGPVFSSCSPTYFVILATVLPQNLAMGIIDLIAYAAGLSLVLLLISLLGQKFVAKIRWAANPNGWFKRGLGVLFILVGIFILTGADKRVQTYLLERGYYNVTNLEQGLLPSTGQSLTTPGAVYPRYQEIVDPSGFVNSEPFTLSELVGKKVILVDFMTYSCINCIRTFPYLNDWYEKYHDDGLEIVGIHTPEFAFEHKIENVEEAAKKYGLKFPIVLDNDYGTWQAYQNNYWPRKYLIDLNGNIVYDHIGEGHYAETEAILREVLGLPPDTGASAETETARREAVSPETYFGAARNSSLANGQRGLNGVQNLTAPATIPKNVLVLDGSWNFTPEAAQPTKNGAKIIYKYQAREVYLVASAGTPTNIRVKRDGVSLATDQLGIDVGQVNGEAIARISDERLYSLIENDDGQEHLLEITVDGTDLKAYTFTFGTD